MEECEACDELIFHRGCKAEHSKQCSKKSRTQRSLAVAVQTIQDKESELESANAQLAMIKSRIQQLESEIADARNKRAKVETELKADNAGKNGVPLLEVHK
jgi:septal ring factor EnvC (AmiA/AmiB activator)